MIPGNKYHLLTMQHNKRAAQPLTKPLNVIKYAISGGSITLPVGTYEISKTIEIGNGTPTSNSTLTSLSLYGSGSGANEAELDNLSAGTLLRWTGPVGEPMIRINGPIYNVRIKGLSLDCNNSAQGIQADHPVCSRFDDISIRNPRDYGLRLRSTAAARPGMVVGAGGSKLTNIRVFSSNTSSIGFYLGADDMNSVGSSGNIYEQCSVLGGAIGFKLRFTDYIKMTMCQAYYCIVPMLVHPPDGSQYYPSAIYAEQWTADKEPSIIGYWNPYPNTGVVFTQYHREWNGGPADQDSSFGPLFPKKIGFSGTDNRGTVFPMLH